MDEAIKELIKLLKTLSPELWRILLKQVEVKLYKEISNSFGIFVISLVFLYIARTIKKTIKKEDKKLENTEGYYETAKIENRINTYWGVFWTLIIIGVVFFIFSFFVSTNVIGYIINPEYYAIQILIEQIK